MAYQRLKCVLPHYESQQGGLGIELLDYIVPGTGRSFPDDWRSYDIAHMQIQLVVEDLEAAVNTLRENGVEIVSHQIVQFPDSYPYREAARSWGLPNERLPNPKGQACTVKDPNGHAMMLITV